VQRQRTDFQHQTALALLHTYDPSYLADVQVANMVQNHPLAKSINDASWYAFRTILEGKAVSVGRRVAAVPPAFTSQDGSGCGTRVHKTRSLRTHTATHCGLVMDRDENATLTSLRAGQARQARTWPGAARVA
jgi:putative transposase